jgi:hypothetical protein
VTHITYAATWFTLAIFGAVLTRRMFAPSSGARVHDAVGRYMVQQDAKRAAAASGKQNKAAAGMLLLPLLAFQASRLQPQRHNPRGAVDIGVSNPSGARV